MAGKFTRVPERDLAPLRNSSRRTGADHRVPDYVDDVEEGDESSRSREPTSLPSQEEKSPNRTMLRRAMATLNILRYSRRYVRAIDDFIEIRGLSIHRTVSMEIQHMDGSGWQPGEEVVVPILMPRRGELVANLRVSDAASARVRLLTHAEHQAHSVAMMLLQVFQSVPDHETFSSAASLDLLWSLPVADPGTAMAIGTRVTASSPVEVRDESVSDAQQLRTCWELAEGSTALSFLVDLFKSKYIVLAETRAGLDGRVFVQFEYDSPYVEPPSASPTRRNRFRKLLGLRPPDYTFYLGSGPHRVETFHVRAEAPRGHYVADSKFRVADGSVPHDQVRDLDRSHLREPRRDVDSVIFEKGAEPVAFAHLYCAKLPNDDATAFAEISFSERPPGSLGQALMTAAIALLPLVAIALIFRPLFGGLNRASSALPAFVVGIPGVVAVTLGIRQDGRSLSATPLLPYLAQFVTGFICLLAALALLVVDASTNASLFWGVTTVEAGQAVLALLCGVQFMLVCVLFVRHRVALAFLKPQVLPITVLDVWFLAALGTALGQIVYPQEIARRVLVALKGGMSVLEIVRDQDRALGGMPAPPENT